MYKIQYLILLLIAILSVDGLAQKEKTKPVKITPEIRMQSEIFADGLREFYADNYLLAEKSFRELLSKNSKNDAAWFMLGKIKIAKKEFAGASYYLNEAIKLDNANVWYKVEQAQNYSNLGDYILAAKIWENICKIDAKNELFLYNLSDVYINLEKYSEVIKIYNRLEKLVGMNEELTRVKRNIYLYLNDLKSAVSEYDKLIKEYPNNPLYYINAGDIYMSNNVPDKALPYYQKALQAVPDNPQANLAIGNYWAAHNNTQRSFDAYLIAFKSRELEKEAKLPILRTYLSKTFKSQNSVDIQQITLLADALTDANPDAVEGPATQGSLFFLQGLLSNAKEAFARAVAIDHTQYSIWVDFLGILERLGDYATIIDYAPEITELYPTNATILFQIGNAYKQTAKPLLALDYFKQATTFAFEPALIVRIYRAIGDVYTELKNWEEAEKYYKMAESKSGNKF